MKLWAKILIAIALGAVTGVIIGPNAIYLKPIGTLFLNLLNMLIVPLVFSSMVMGVVSSPDMKRLGRVGGITLLLYAVTTIFALVLGMCVSSWLQLGTQMKLSAQAATVTTELPSFADLFLTLVPKNPFKAFVEGNILQVIIFSVLFGIALNFVRDKAQGLIDCINATAQVMFRLTSMIMAISPIGVFALMAWATGSFGLEVLVPVLKFLLSYYVAAFIFAVVVFGGILFFMAKLSPWPFFKGMTEAIATAISTCSSSATLPANIHCATQKLGISKNLANFVLPLGCSLNMNGSALFQAMSALFIAQAYGIELGMQQLILLAVTVILATIGTASIPGAGLLMLSIVFSAIGIPLEGIAILASIDRLRDMATTTLNITGDTVCAMYVAVREGELDTNRYYSNSPGEIRTVEITSDSKV